MTPEAAPLAEHIHANNPAVPEVTMEPNESDIGNDLRWMRDPTAEPPANQAMTIEQRQRTFRARSASPETQEPGSDWVRDTPLSKTNRLRRARGILVSAVIVAVLLLAVVALSNASSQHTSDPLEAVVQVAVNPPVQAQPDPDRPVLHLIYEISGAGSDGADLGRPRTEMWHAWRRADGSGREDRGGRPRTIAPSLGVITPNEARVEDPPPGAPTPTSARDDGTAGTFSATIGGYPINQSLIDELPREPGALRALLIDLIAGRDLGLGADGSNRAATEGAPPPLVGPVDSATRDALLFQGASDLLVSWLAPPTLRSAALEIVGGLPGVTVREDTDRAGQGVLRLTLSHDGRTEVFIDPVTSAVTGRRVVDADGTVTYELQLVAADWVAAVPEP